METEKEKRQRLTPVAVVRQSDIEPYTALRWVSSLFKGAAVFLAVAVIGEFVAGIRFEGAAAISTLMGELARTVVLAVVLWGGGDMVRLLIHLGHDIRAERILMARLVHRLPVPPESAHEEVWGRDHPLGSDEQEGPGSGAELINFEKENRPPEGRKVG
jgi:hypothetical protein